ncbi:hypothetical protein BCR32DRAFT_297727 [Anaeromyces robustus]|uniref:Protein OS-9 homolog n=1 Tax=Anaeromyces robustus TaxID=1754192 RepID=A0A1Y1VVT1_9FUNG|nr:hypothetical protein BCR32DRAFT_297727 [Anaeromyces robustus]|eukprot:ORX65398.1 hypothetical protein BCR32DRAFT_297727 [Anaeromyces robustus]
MKFYKITLLSIILKNTVFAFSNNYIYEDSLSKPQFQIYFSDQILSSKEIDVLERETKNEIIKMVSKENNEHYICEIPKVKKEKEKRINRNKAGNVKTALALLEPMKNKCLYHTSGWWSYEFCYGKSIRQYHIATKNEPARFNSNYILGKYNKYLELSSGKTEETKELVRIAPNGKNYLSQKFIDGTKCDKTNIPRTTEIQYYCGLDESIIYVKEVSTCTYEVAISTTRLCKDPVFNSQVKKSINSILCYLYKSDKTDNKNSDDHSLTSDDYNYEKGEENDDQSDEEKLLEIHNKYKKENMKKASDIFKRKWMKSVNFKNKKVLVNPFFSTKNEEGEEDDEEYEDDDDENENENENEKHNDSFGKDGKKDKKKINNKNNLNNIKVIHLNPDNNNIHGDNIKDIDKEVLNEFVNKLKELNKEKSNNSKPKTTKDIFNPPFKTHISKGKSDPSTKKIILDEFNEYYENHKEEMDEYYKMKKEEYDEKNKKEKPIKKYDDPSTKQLILEKFKKEEEKEKRKSEL